MESKNNNDKLKPKLLITGCSGLIGSRLIEHLREEFVIVGLDQQPLPDAIKDDALWIECDLTSDESVADAICQAVDRCGHDYASVIHLAAYYDFSGEPSPLYRSLTIEGTRRLLRELQPLHVEQLIFSSTLLVMEPSPDDQPITETSPVEAEWAYPQSKLAAEQVIARQRGDIPAVCLRIAGVYDEDCHSLPLSQQISRIYEKQLESFFFPGDKEHGQAFVHLDDLANCIRQTILKRAELDPFEVFLIAEPDVMSYDELQEELGTMIHGKAWPTIRIPKSVAKAGAWLQDKLASDKEDEPFIKPWMIDLADQDYPVNILKAQHKLDWKPRHSLRQTLPEMIGRFHHDPAVWYETNHLPLPEDMTSK